MLPAALADRLDYVRALPFSDPPQPWSKIVKLRVGGLQAIGFAESSDLLLVKSQDKTGILDCSIGQFLDWDVANDSTTDWQNLSSVGFGVLRDQKIRLAGLFGGGLLRVTSDGWTVCQLGFDWPNDEILLCPPDESIFDTTVGETSKVTKLGNFSSELRAFGFSPTDQTLVIATAADLLLFGRKP